MNSQLDPQNQMFTYHEVRVQEVMKDSSSEVKKVYYINLAVWWDLYSECRLSTCSGRVQ